MENNNEEILGQIIANKSNDNEINDLGYLLNVILDYYLSSNDTIEEGEEWKKGTELQKDIIPEKIDNLINKAFESQLKKFIK